MSDWQGSNPFYLIIETMDNRVGIDLDEPGWGTTYADVIHAPGHWQLIHKETGRGLLYVIAGLGERGYYKARHIGITGGGGGNEIIAYGLGVNRGGVERTLWLLPNGVVCADDDVEVLGTYLLYQLGPR